MTLNYVFNLFHLDHGATVIQRRKDGSVNFDQTWEKYENGFGDFQGERNYYFLETFSTITLRRVTKLIINCQILNYLACIVIITFAVLSLLQSCTRGVCVRHKSGRRLLNSVSSLTSQ